MELDIKPKAVKDLAKIQAKIRKNIIEKINFYREGNRCDVIKLTDVKPIKYRMRVGDYRVLFHIENNTMVVSRVVPKNESSYSKKNKK